MTIAQVMKEVEKDIVFYDESGGGVTFSGGEPLMQPHFLTSLLKACREVRLHTAVDTCGYADSEILLRISEYVDLFLYDVKVINDEKHRKFTGVSNKVILENMEKLSHGACKIVVRFPLIPGVNDGEEDIRELGAFVSSLRNVKELSILPYHIGGVEKSKRLRKPQDSSFVTHSPSAGLLSEVERELRTFGLRIRLGE
jgi:pyruvate formate lyase activating enzyme